MISELYKLQLELDKTISKKFVNTNNQNDILNLKILSLYVEVSELANETRCFKYWSVSQVFKSSETVLEEYADGLHFLLSIGNDLDQNKNINYETIFSNENNKKSNIVISKLFLEILENISLLETAKGIENKKLYHLKLMDKYFILGKHLGLTYIEIVNAYKKKNKINYQRIANNY